VNLAGLVDGVRAAAEEKQECAARGRHLDRMKLPVQREDRQRQRITAPPLGMEDRRVRGREIVVDFERPVELVEPAHHVGVTNIRGARLKERGPQSLGELRPWHSLNVATNGPAWRPPA